MEVIVKPRRGGKTYRLVELAAQSFSYIVCIDKREATRVFGVSKDMSVDIPFPITWDDFVNHRYHGAGVKGFIIDNLDVCIQSMTDEPIQAVSLTGGIDLPSENLKPASGHSDAQSGAREKGRL